jgi:hypothetical protein
MMKPPVKTLALITIFFLSLDPTNAQTKSNPGSTTGSDVRKIIEDYPNHFENLKGEIIIQNPQWTDYQCHVKPAGSEESIITRFSGKRNFVSWRSVVLTTESFTEARKKFSSLYMQLNNLPVGSMRLKGNYEAPTEEKKFNSTIFSFDTPGESFRKLKVELVMEADQMEWKVKLLIYDRDREDDERGEIIED